MPPKSSSSSSVDITNLDKQIEHLMECKPLSEPEVKALCEKVLNKMKILIKIMIVFSIKNIKGERNPWGRVQCAAGALACDSVRRYSRTVPRSY